MGNLDKKIVHYFIPSNTPSISHHHPQSCQKDPRFRCKNKVYKNCKYTGKYLQFYLFMVLIITPVPPGPGHHLTALAQTPSVSGKRRESGK
jgi:hypothetical protein